MRLHLRIGAALALPVFLFAFQTPPARDQAVAPDEAPVFQIKTNLVLVPVVVRDGKGKAVADLTREDFVLTDKGKPQAISKFSVEQPAAKPAEKAAEKAVEKAIETPSAAQGQKQGELPERYIAYLFDDVHLTFNGLVNSRKASVKYLSGFRDGSARIGIFTGAGKTVQDFTDDQSKIKQAIEALEARKDVDLERTSTPPLTYRDAAVILDGKNEALVNSVIERVLDQMGLGVQSRSDNAVLPILQAKSIIRAEAERTVARGERETRATLNGLRGLVQRMGAMPGQRVIVLVSPGFYTFYQLPEVAEIVDQAVRLNVTVHTLDPAGLGTGATPANQRVYRNGARDFGGLDMSKSTGSPRTSSPVASTSMPGGGPSSGTQNANWDTMGWIAEGTGGMFFHNRNDLKPVFERATAAPEVRYLLGFSPASLSLDGSFHEVKVSLRNGKGLTVQARRGYYAPDANMDAAKAAQQEIEEAVFSRDEIGGIPAELQTQFSRPSADTARLSVVARIDIGKVSFRKADGRNRDDLTVISALFDRNGVYVAGTKKTIEMRLRDQTLAGQLGLPVAVESSFDVRPGTYTVRVVMRDAEGQQMSAANRVVEIP